MSDPKIRALARQILTGQQLRTFELEARGMSQYAIALALDLSRSTVRNHLREAHRKLEQALRSKEAA